MKFFDLFKNEKGQATVEFALILPILLLVVCGIIDFGWFFSKKIQLQSASYTGARYAIVSNNDAISQEVVFSQIRAALPGTSPSTLGIQLSYSSGLTGNVTVTLTESVEALTPITQIFTNQNIIIKASATMKMSY
ncbi:MAG: TadE-like protein [Bacillales bacterium]|jgi:Flp pilus assembly protein TadG|nr:TadE-like protein [Bacillales bacterium]